MRVIAYYRVSKAEQVEGYSLDAQRHAIEKHCADHGHEIVGYFADEGISAKYDSVSKRPGFKAALDVVAKNQADAIAVHKLDRFARNARVFHDSLHQVSNHVIFVVEGIDLSTPTGELMAGVLAQFSQFFSRNLGAEAKKGLDERRRQGLYNGGPLPFGVAKDPTGKDPRRALPVPDGVPVLTTIADRKAWSRHDALLFIFNAVVQGKSSIQIANELRNIGFELSAPGVRHIILNRFYVGEIPMGHRPHSPHAHLWAPGAHEPIIDPVLFAAANQIATNMPCLRRITSVRRSAQRWALTGLLVCGRCRGPMHVKSHKDGTRVECYNRYDKQRCNQPSFKQDRLKSQIAEILRGYALTDEVIQAVEQHRNGASTTPDAHHDIRRLELQRQRLDDLYIDGSITKDRYRNRAARIEAELAQLEALHVEPMKHTDIGNLLRDLPSLYEAANQAQRNELLHLIFEALMVDDYTVVAVKPQPVVASLLGEIAACGHDGGLYHEAPFPNAESVPRRMKRLPCDTTSSNMGHVHMAHGTQRTQFWSRPQHWRRLITTPSHLRRA